MAPTLLVYGMRDTLISLVEECEMERTIPKVRAKAERIILGEGGRVRNKSLRFDTLRNFGKSWLMVRNTP